MSSTAEPYPRHLHRELQGDAEHDFPDRLWVAHHRSPDLLNLPFLWNLDAHVLEFTEDEGIGRVALRVEAGEESRSSLPTTKPSTIANWGCKCQVK